MSDPLVLDVVLHESGWSERFLAERGELLPPDEWMLAQAWTLVDRTVYEVEQTRPVDGVTVRDLRTGDRVEVRERTFSRTARVGQRVCARAVPDGVTHQLIGGIFGVPVGREPTCSTCSTGGTGSSCWRGSPPCTVRRSSSALTAEF